MELKTVLMADLIPYENNPRVNDGAVDAVVDSINQVGYVTPIVVDEDMVILAGHTRFKALTSIGVESAEVIVMEGLNEEQKKKFRILDNKTNELAEWDNDLLRGELEGLDLGGIHWFDDIINPNIGNLGSSPSSDGNSAKQKEDDGPVICPRCGAIVDGVDEPDDEEFPF